MSTTLQSGRVAALRAERFERDERLAAVKRFTVRRSFTMKGRRYQIGDRFKPTADLPFSKLAQLIDFRYLEMDPPKVEAARRFNFQGRAFVPGDAFPLEGLRPEKVAQLLEQRFIQPQATA